MADLTLSNFGRGTCPVCGREVALKRDGTIRHHGGEQGTGDLGFGRAYRCKGSGELPRGGAS